MRLTHATTQTTYWAFTASYELLSTPPRLAMMLA